MSACLGYSSPRDRHLVRGWLERSPCELRIDLRLHRGGIEHPARLGRPISQATKLRELVFRFRNGGPWHRQRAHWHQFGGDGSASIGALAWSWSDGEELAPGDLALL